MDNLIVNHRKIPFTLRRSSRARHMRLQIKSDKPELVLIIPRWTLGIEIDRFLEKQAGWIEKHWSKIEKQSKLRPKPKYLDGDTFYYFGEPLTLQLIPAYLKKPMVRIRDNKMQVSVYRYVTMSEGKKMVKKAIQEFYKQKASETIHDRLEYFNEHYQFHYNRVTFRNQKTRWGSCSTRKNLNFNWRLIMAPIQVIDYVVVHEMCHLEQMNHSKKYWELVAQRIPNYKEVRKWLRENQFLLKI
jgi:predicted metal-dependent hydrolase